MPPSAPSHGDSGSLPIRRSSEPPVVHQPILGLGVRSLLEAGRRLGFEFEVICDHPLNVIRVIRDKAGFLFQTWPGFITLRRRDDYASLIDKSAQKTLLAGQGLPVPRRLACVASGDELAAAHVTFPCVAKPCLGTYSRSVFTHIFTPEVLRAAVSRVTAGGRRALIEQHVHGSHYRVLCVGGLFAGCVERRAPRVVGDDVHTIGALIARRNREPGRWAEGRGPTLLHPIPISAATEAYLSRQGHTLDSVLPAGKVARLSRRVTGRDGADFIDASDRIHPDTVKLCEAFARRHRLFMTGFDLITPRIESSLLEAGVCNEVNVREVDATCIEHCNVGVRRPVSRYVWERVPFDRVAAPWCPAW